jgi:hypothetical protein
MREPNGRFAEGNTLGVNSGGGRPRSHDREKLMAELIEWAQLDDSINLNKFCCTRKPPISPCTLPEYANEDPVFDKAYKTAKAFIGMRREEKLTNGQLHVKAYDLNATVYDYYLKLERREQAKFESELAKSDSKPVNDSTLLAIGGLMDMITKAQKDKKGRDQTDLTTSAIMDNNV